MSTHLKHPLSTPQGCPVLRRLVKPTMELKPKLPTSTRYGAHMDIGQYGDLNTLQWVENEFDPEPNMVHCEVIYGEPSRRRPRWLRQHDQCFQQ